MKYRVTVTVPMEACITVDADDKKGALDKILDGVCSDSYNNGTAGFDLGLCADKSIEIEEVYTYYNFDIKCVEEI